MTTAFASVRRIAALAVVATVLAGSMPAVAGIPPQLRTPGTLGVCSDPRATPISSGDGEGYEVALLRAVAATWGVAMDITPVETDDGIWLAPSDPALGCDVAIGGITPTEAPIAAGAVFTPPTARLTQTLLVRPADLDSGRITGYASFAGTGMVIGAVSGTTVEEVARRRAAEAGLPDDAVRAYPSEVELRAAFATGEIDAIAWGQVGDGDVPTFDPALVAIDPRDIDEGIAIAVDPANPDLLAALTATLALVTADGTVGYDEWLEDPGVLLATAGIPGETEREAWSITKGTSVRLVNHAGKRLYYRLHSPVSGWGDPMWLPAGAEDEIARNFPAFDDVELHLFDDESAANAHDRDRMIDIQAENPAWNAPWVSYHRWTEYFQSEGESHDVNEGCSWRADNRFWVKRESDSSSYKRFTIEIKEVVILPNGEHRQCEPVDF